MNVVQNSVRFSFNYVDAFQSASLDVAAQIYDVSTGTPVFVDTVVMEHTEYGVYVGAFVGEPFTTYLVISAVYTDNTYLIPDTTYAPSSDEFQCLNTTITFFAFDYTDYGQANDLLVRATVNDLTTGSPVMVDQIEMVYVTLGCYFASFTGILGHTYEVSKMVFTDGTYTTPDPERSAGADSLQAQIAGGLNVFNTIRSATLIGQSLKATLRERQ